MKRDILRNEVKRELGRLLTDTLLSLFERKKKGDRKTDRRYAQVLEARDQLSQKRKRK